MSARGSEAIRKKWADPEYRAKQMEKIRARNASPEWRERLSQIMRERCASPEYRARIAASVKATKGTPEAREKARQATIRRYEDPAARAAHSELIRAAIARDPEPWQIRASLIHGGGFVCPPEHKRLYEKLRRLLGAKAAREEIRKIVADEFARTVDYSEAA